MARSSKNTDLVPQEVFVELSKLDTQLDSTKGKLNEILAPVVKVTEEFNKSAIGTRALRDALDALATAEGKLPKVYSEEARLKGEIVRLTEKLNHATSEEAKAVANLREQLRQTNNEVKNEQKSILAASNSIESMRIRVAQLKKEWASSDIGSEQFKRLSKELSEANAKLIEVESNVGIFGRNVGNYNSAFQGMQYSVQQVARELPSLSIGLSQFFLAISNNIPILVDDINKAREANAALAADGKKGVPIFKQLASSIFSWQTALVVGITLLTVYGKDVQKFITNLFSAKKATIDLKEAVVGLSKEIEKNGAGIGDEIAVLKKLQSQWNAFGNDLEAKKKFIEENREAFHNLGVEVGNIGDAENVLVNNSSNFIKSMRLKAEATAAFKLASKAYEEYIKAEKEWLRIATDNGTAGEKFWYSITGLSGLKNDMYSAKSEADSYFKLYENIEKKLKELNEKSGFKTPVATNSTASGGVDRIAEFRKKLSEAEARAEINGKQFQLKEGAELNKEIYRDELNSYEKRIKAADDYTRAMKESVEARAEAQKNDLIRDAAIGLGLDPDKDRVEAEKYVAKQIEVINMKKNVELEKMDRQHSEIIKDIWEDNVKQAVQATIASLNSALAESTNRENEAMQALNAQFTSGGMSNQRYEIEKNKIAEQYAKERIQIQIDELQKRLEIEGLSETDRLALTKKIADLEFKEKQLQSDKEIELAKKTNDARKQLAQEAYQFMNQLVMQNFESKIKALEEEAEKNEEWRDEEIARIERFEEAGALSKEQADARKAAIDDQAKLREKELEQQKKEILRKQAMYEKAQALASVGINIAQAITATLAQFGMPLAAPFIAAVGALGAVQIASILSTPIPEYAEGTQDHPGGLAIVGDGGKSEMVIANGRIFKTPSKDTLVELPKHAMVLPDFASALENKLPNMNTDRVLSFEELSDLMRDGNSKTDKLIKMFSKQMKNDLYARELNKVRRITR